MSVARTTSKPKSSKSSSVFTKHTKTEMSDTKRSRPSNSQSVVLTSKASKIKETMTPIDIDDSDLARFILSKTSLDEGGFGKVNKVNFELIEKHIENLDDFKEELDIYLEIYKKIEYARHPHKYNKKIYNLFVNAFFYSSQNQRIYMEPLNIMDKILEKGTYNKDIFKQIFLNLIAFNHFYGLSHQDFKPKNVGIDIKGRIKLFDFGLSVPLGNYSANRTTYYYPIHLLDQTTKKNIEYTFTIKIRGFMYKASYFDMYSFGITLYDYIFNQHPFEYNQKRYTKSDKTRMISDYITKRKEFKSKLTSGSMNPSFQNLFESLFLMEPGTILNGDNMLKVLDTTPTSSNAQPTVGNY